MIKVFEMFLYPRYDDFLVLKVHMEIDTKAFFLSRRVKKDEDVFMFAHELINEMEGKWKEIKNSLEC